MKITKHEGSCLIFVCTCQKLITDASISNPFIEDENVNDGFLKSIDEAVRDLDSQILPSENV